MPFPELVINDAPPPAAGLPSRADVAVFVGLVGRRAGPVPANVASALAAAGWSGAGPFARSASVIDALLDVPVAVASWDEFDLLYAWNERSLGGGTPLTLGCPLGLAVRTFFAEGGVKAWIVRTGDPLPLLSGKSAAKTMAEKRALLSWIEVTKPDDADQRVALIPGLGSVGTSAEATDPSTWHGAAHIWGIDDAAMLSLPDLPTLCGLPPDPLAPLTGAPPVPEQFKPCAPDAPTVVPDPRITRPPVTAPRLNRAGYILWGSAITQLLGMLAAPRGAAHRRDVMLIASLPLPHGDVDLNGAETAPLVFLDSAGTALGGGRLTDEAAIGSARLQLAWPWIATAQSVDQPEGIEAPEAALLGAIARTALAQGAFRSAASVRLSSVTATIPELRVAETRVGLPDGRADWLGDRLCLIGRKVEGFALLSDATMAHRRDWRAGGVSRLMGIVLRAARWLGQERLFDPSGPNLWAAIRLDLEGFMKQLRTAGALDGATEAAAFTVRCDSTTMSQADIDAGRTIATIAFTAAQPIQRIEVTLALSDAGLSQMAEAA